MDEHELAWAAGFFDGDGWTALVRPRGRKRGQPHAQINQSSLTGVPEVLVRFRDAAGVGRINGPKLQDGREPLYSWIASSRGDVLRTGSLIGPWLSHEKRNQFSSAVALRFDAEPVDSVAWAAGLFDAEGSTALCVHRSHSGYKVIDASITQGSPTGVPEELVRFARVVKVGRAYGPYLQKGATEPIFRWRAYTTDEARRALHVLQPWLGQVKRMQARRVLKFLDDQPVLPRGRVEWGSHKTHCIHGHEYAAARRKPYVSRAPGRLQRRDSKQCLVCVREQTRLRYVMLKSKIGGDPAADLDSGAE